MAHFCVNALAGSLSCELEEVAAFELLHLAGGAVMAVGTWTLAEKSDYISLLSSSTYSATAYILVVAGVVVMVTGILGCCATFKERRNLLRVYFILLLCIFLLEIIAGILAYIYYQQLSLELKQNLKNTMTQKYRTEGEESVTSAVDKLQQEFKCCGSNNYTDWADSLWIKSSGASGRKVPDSCCKTITDLCGRRDHPSNIYKESGCITKLENFIQEHLKIIGAVGISIACVQIFGMIFTCCLYKSLNFLQQSAIRSHKRPFASQQFWSKDDGLPFLGLEMNIHQCFSASKELVNQLRVFWLCLEAQFTDYCQESQESQFQPVAPVYLQCWLSPVPSSRQPTEAESSRPIKGLAVLWGFWFTEQKSWAAAKGRHAKIQS
ncbi:hypothetical protein IHE44_0014091, partial [Lamprotornis superbus]